jgi:hypothetical protein
VAKACSLSPAPDAASDEAAMDIISQLDQLKRTAEKAGEYELAAQVAQLFDGYINRYCDSKRAGLEADMRHHFRRPKEYLN